jgi:hypothetical protein
MTAKIVYQLDSKDGEILYVEHALNRLRNFWIEDATVDSIGLAAWKRMFLSAQFTATDVEAVMLWLLMLSARARRKYRGSADPIADSVLQAAQNAKESVDRLSLDLIHEMKLANQHVKAYPVLVSA